MYTPPFAVVTLNSVSATNNALAESNAFAFIRSNALVFVKYKLDEPSDNASVLAFAVAPVAMPSNLVPSVATSLPSTVPDTAILPTTSKACDGDDVPIPTLPSFLIRILSAGGEP